MFRFLSKSSAAAMIVALSFSVNTVAAKKEPLFSHSAAAVGQLPPNAKKDHRRSVNINYGQLRSGRLQLNLFDDLALEAVRKRHVTYKDKGEVWIGQIAGNPDSQVALARVGQSIHGTIQIGDDLYKLAPGKGGSHTLVQVDGGLPYPEHGPKRGFALADTQADTIASGSADGGSSAADGGSVVDVMVAYTPAAASATSNIESLILLAIEETNQAYLNSGVNAQLRLVHTLPISYVESTTGMQTDLDRLTTGNDGYMDVVHSYRDSYGADMVSLIVKRSDYCGIAWLMNNPTANFAASAFSVVNYSCATGYYSFGHELGHNMGVTHAREDTSGSGAFPYSYGHKDNLNRSFRTIMAYNCASGCTRRQFFSNPDFDYNGIPTGIDHDHDPYQSADNARSLNGTVANVMSWRQAAASAPPTAPANLGLTVLSSSDIALTWSDQSDNEAGFAVERSTDSSSWQTVANTSSNATAYSDAALAANTTYYYRVKAYNSAGESAHTLTASATTETAPPSFNQHVTSEQTNKGSVSGSYSALRSADNYRQTLREVSSGGKPKKRTSVLQHIWRFDLQPGKAHSLKVVASAAVSKDDDGYQFLYSTDGVNYADAFTLRSGDAGEYQALLPANYSGPLHVLVRDTDSTARNLNYDTLSVDQLLVVTENVLGNPPLPPSNLSATGVTSDSVQLSWTNNSSINRSGSYIFRDGSLLDTVSASAASYTDSGLTPATDYQYTVRAFNSAGSSADSNPASATTDASSGPTLSARGYKVKGGHRIDLSWSPSSEVDIYRNGSLITSAGGGAYTDIPRTKGSATFSYQVCDKGTSQCSQTQRVEF